MPIQLARAFGDVREPDRRCARCLAKFNAEITAADPKPQAGSETKFRIRPCRSVSPIDRFLRHLRWHV